MTTGRIKYLIAALLLLPLSGCIASAEGDKVGTIIKIAKQGLIWGTWEAEIVKGGMSAGGGAFGGAFHFTVSSSENVKVLQQAMEQQREVKIHYRKESLYLPWTSESDGYFIESVTVLGK